jgi:hypothetical protein
MAMEFFSLVLSLIWQSINLTMTFNFKSGTGFQIPVSLQISKAGVGQTAMTMTECHLPGALSAGMSEQEDPQARSFWENTSNAMMVALLLLPYVLCGCLDSPYFEFELLEA